MKSIWHTYQSCIYKNCAFDGEAKTRLSYWRNALFASTLLYLFPLCLITLIPGLYMAYITDMHGLIVFDIITVGSVIVVAFAPGMSINHRKIIFCCAVYLISVVLLYYLGSFGPGLLYLLALTTFSLIILDNKYALWIFILNVLTCTIFGFLIYYGISDSALIREYHLDAWIGVSSNLVFLSGVMSLLIPRLFHGLQSTLHQEKELRKELRSKQAKLEESLKQLNESNKELEEFAYIASHDLKEPLRMIRSFMELLDMKYSDKLDEKAKKYIHFAVDGSQRMTELINDLLEYSRVGRVHTTHDELDTEKVLDEISNYFAADFDEKNARIDYESLPVIYGVPVSIKMLFQNLIGNSLKYHSENVSPVINIEATERDAEWLFPFKTMEWELRKNTIKPSLNYSNDFIPKKNFPEAVWD